ncbi:MAG: hypothetical protein ACSHW0_09250 [Thalassotalea sp.]
MKEPLNSVAETIAKANDVFSQQYKHIDTLIGILDKALRNQGIPADAVTIDCPAADKKIVFLLHDNQPDAVEIALGNKVGDIFSSSKLPLNELIVGNVIEIMQQNLITN